MPSTPKIADILAHINHTHLREIAAHQLASGHSREEVIADVVATIDALIPWGVIGPAGVVIEAIDGPLATLIAGLIVPRHPKK